MLTSTCVKGLSKTRNYSLRHFYSHKQYLPFQSNATKKKILYNFRRRNIAHKLCGLLLFASCCMETSFLKTLQNVSNCIPGKQHTGLKVNIDYFDLRLNNTTALGTVNYRRKVKRGLTLISWSNTHICVLYGSDIWFCLSVRWKSAAPPLRTTLAGLSAPGQFSWHHCCTGMLSSRKQREEELISSLALSFPLSFHSYLFLKRSVNHLPSLSPYLERILPLLMFTVSFSFVFFSSQTFISSILLKQASLLL